MGQKEKLIQKLRSRPVDFTFEEAETLLRYFDYSRNNKGRTSGSRVMFTSRNTRRSCSISHTRGRNYWHIRSSSLWKYWNRRV